MRCRRWHRGAPHQIWDQGGPHPTRVPSGIDHRDDEARRHHSRIAFPPAAGAREVLGDDLRAEGGDVVEVVAYRTLLASAERDDGYDIYAMLLERQIDAITFTSASTVRNFVQMLGRDQAADLLRTTTVACIGPVTAEAAQQLDIETTVMPERYTIPDLVDALVEHFSEETVKLG